MKVWKPIYTFQVSSFYVLRSKDYDTLTSPLLTEYRVSISMTRQAMAEYNRREPLALFNYGRVAVNFKAVMHQLRIH